MTAIIIDEEEAKKQIEAFFKVKNVWDRIVLVKHTDRLELLRVAESDIRCLGQRKSKL